jgi:ribosome modulation factor
MSEFQPVETKADLERLDDDEILAGYLAGLSGESEPGSDKSRAYWHGWRNGMVDSGRAQIDCAQVRLAREVVGTYRGLH